MLPYWYGRGFDFADHLISGLLPSLSNAYLVLSSVSQQHFIVVVSFFVEFDVVVTPSVSLAEISR